MNSLTGQLVDQHGRHIHKLRLTILDACNFKCIYCMPEEQQFLSKDKLLSKDQIFHIADELVNLGIDEIRLTGGEPTLREDLVPIVKELSKLKLKKLGLTTNGVHLKKILPFLKESGCHFLNISLDSLNKKTFRMFSGKDQLQLVLESILTAKEMGFVVKINTVLMKGLNDHEVEDFILFSKENDIEVRFLELMKIGVGQKYYKNCFISADEIITKILEHHKLQKLPSKIDATSFNFLVDDVSQIGFIASESKPFCSGCSRLRLGPLGEIRPCLMLNSGISLIGKTSKEIHQILLETMSLKPIERIENVEQSMNQIGG